MLLLAWLCYDFFTLISEGFFSKKGKLLAYTLHILITQCMCMAWNAVYSAAAAMLDIYVMNLVGTACSIWSQRPSLPTQNGPCLHTLHLFLHSLHIRAAEIMGEILESNYTIASLYTTHTYYLMYVHGLECSLFDSKIPHKFWRVYYTYRYIKL